VSKWLPVPVAVGIALMGLAMPTTARLLENWSYERLMKESDLVVIATAVKTEATADKGPEHSWPYEFVGQETTFKVTNAIKGKPPAETFKVLHFKFGELKKREPKKELSGFDTAIINGSQFVSFRTGEYKLILNGETRMHSTAPDYLLYLRALKDGRYEPVSGQIDPNLSVRMLIDPDSK
jgi:hypothetical protein